jgi:GNAT superfamily N-acetyltransferase
MILNGLGNNKDREGENKQEMNQNPQVAIEPMREADLVPGIDLISTAMNKDEAVWAADTIRFYFECKRHGLDSGRQYYVWRQQGGVRGLVGLHRYLWGPRENVWLSWFAVHPAHQGQNIGSAMLEAVEDLARQAGFRKFLVETYDSPTFAKARSFYESKGFSQAGRVENYLPDGSGMVIFLKRLQTPSKAR